MTKLTSILILILFLSCKSDKHDSHQKYNEKTINVVNDNLKTDSTFSGYGGQYYSNGNLKFISKFKNGETIDTLFFYYENGKVKEKGLLKNGLRYGWWSYFKKNGALKEKIEWKPREGDTINLNQILVFDDNGNIKIEPSTYFEIEIPDTLVIGSNFGYVKKYVSNLNDVNERFLYVIVENRYPDNQIRKDTFVNRNLNPFFYVTMDEIGKQIIKVKLQEKVIKAESINKDESTITVIDHFKYYEKEVFVSSKKEISKKGKEIMEEYIKYREKN